MGKKCITTIVALALTIAASGAAVSGEEAVVVYNSSMAESKAVAEYYAAKRKVPPDRVFGFEMPNEETISRATFRDTLQRPLAKALSSNKLWRIASEVVPATNNQPERIQWNVVESKIRYAVLCYGVPLRISADSNLKEPGIEKLRPEMQRNEAAVDSELALLPAIEQKLQLAGALSNTGYGATNTASLHPTNGVLMVARLDGPTPEIARGLVDKALEAETWGLWGRSYFDLRKASEEGMKMGDDWIAASSELSRRLGFETVVDNNPTTFPTGFPMSHIAWYMGWYDEHISGPLAESKVEFMPGAFAYHLHSFSAPSLRTTDKYWVGPLLARGATASMGNVNEPYLPGTPDLTVFTARFIFAAFSFGEAAYASQSVLSWQTTVVGDPLYRAFEQNPEYLHKTLDEKKRPEAQWSYLRLLNLNLANGKPLLDCAALLEQLALTRTSAVLSEKLADLYSAQGKPSSAIRTYQQALKLDPSPDQQKRLLMTLGEKLVSQNRDDEAYDSYQELAKLDAPDKPGVHTRLASLARKLNKDEDAKLHEAEAARLRAAPK